ncbi:hypothetical protein KSF_089230 [Reticulibacter mediterranei]|uniref:Uncharacterized protein n=1 Tax=Reticulibacter mediterranei TaxID=2778369 RepID=A0A8J3N7V3_9CHLR|nr:hypothetical protein [Reticulibacter mediterranei]GHO98875.1 hypothetical protein KSF_089230 [Reticulibacter mediterranei]
MESRSIPSFTGIVLNPCCLIHMYASGQMEEILLSWKTPVFITAFTYEYENLQREPMDLEPLVQQGAIHVATLSSSELMDATNAYSPVLGVDSEAYALALAHHRNWAIGVDMPVTCSFFRRLVPDIPLLSTFDLLYHWAESRSLSSDVVQEVLQLMHQRVGYKSFSIPHF